jgi:hypothetical protein
VATSTVKYKKPPVVERALTVHVELSEEMFQTKADEWRASLASEFPAAETMTEWTLAVTEKDGMPVLDPSRQTMTVRQTYWKLADKRTKDRGMQFWPDKISFNLIGAPGHPRDYDELKEFVRAWLPRWAAHFGVTKCTGVTLQYVNLLSELTLPQFTVRNQIKLGEVLNMFRGVPNPREALFLPPFDFQVNLECPTTTPPSHFGAHCSALTPAETEGTKVPSLLLRFTATTHLLRRRAVGLEKVDEEAQVMHDLIIDHFQAFFTAEAKKAFEPVWPQ